MQRPMSVAFRGIDASEWIEADIRKRAEKLQSVYRDIISCRVVVDMPHKHHAGGNLFSVRIDLTVPGEEIAVTHEANLRSTTADLEATSWTKQFEVEGARKDLKIVIREVFDVARRRLQEYSRRQRHEVKRHQSHPRGRAAREPVMG